jgi:hypothetical protein
MEEADDEKFGRDPMDEGQLGGPLIRVRRSDTQTTLVSYRNFLGRQFIHKFLQKFSELPFSGSHLQ